MRTRTKKGSLADRKRTPVGVPLTPDQLRQLALNRRAYADGQRLMRRQLHGALKDLIFDSEVTADDLLELILTYPLSPPPAWMKPQEERHRRG